MNLNNEIQSLIHADYEVRDHCKQFKNTSNTYKIIVGTNV